MGNASGEFRQPRAAGCIDHAFGLQPTRGQWRTARDNQPTITLTGRGGSFEYERPGVRCNGAEHAIEGSASQQQPRFFAISPEKLRLAPDRAVLQWIDHQAAVQSAARQVLGARFDPSQKTNALPLRARRCQHGLVRTAVVSAVMIYQRNGQPALRKQQRKHAASRAATNNQAI